MSDDAQGNCILIADNEKKKNLYALPIAEGLVQTGDDHLKKVKLDDQEVADMEALTVLHQDRLLAIGSHSRNSTCEIRPERRRFSLLNRRDGGWAVEIRHYPQEGVLRCKDILTWGTRRLSTYGELVCASLEQAETHADSVEESNIADKEQAKEQCEKSPSLNIEGSVWHDGRVWVGLRSPLVPSGPNQDQIAILLRLKKQLKSIKSNGVALVDLGGWGIRELRAHADSIWLIAGPATDSRNEFKLLKFPKSALKKNALIVPEFVRSLPTSSEGLAFGTDYAFVVIDGDENKCDVMPGSYTAFELNDIVTD